VAVRTIPASSSEMRALCCLMGESFAAWDASPCTAKRTATIGGRRLGACVFVLHTRFAQRKPTPCTGGRQTGRVFRCAGCHPGREGKDLKGMQQAQRLRCLVFTAACVHAGALRPPPQSATTRHGSGGYAKGRRLCTLCGVLGSRIGEGANSPGSAAARRAGFCADTLRSTHAPRQIAVKMLPPFRAPAPWVPPANSRSRCLEALVNFKIKNCLVNFASKADDRLESIESGRVF
jgi:hypothetical protein